MVSPAWKKSLVPHLLNPRLGTPDNHWSFYHLYSCAFFRMSCKWNQTVWSLSDWLISLSKMHLRFRHVVWSLDRTCYPFPVITCSFIFWSYLQYYKLCQDKDSSFLFFILSPLPGRLKKKKRSIAICWMNKPNQVLLEFVV